MTALDVALRNTKKKVCVKYINGKVEKVTLLKAVNLVKEASAGYITKSEYKKVTGEKPENVIREVLVQDVHEHVHEKAKDRKKKKKEKI